MSQSASSSTRDRLAAALFFVLCWGLLFFLCPFNLVCKEQLVLFLCDSSYLGSLLSRPAAAAVIAGDFLTQFFASKAVAATITVLAAMLLWDGFRRFLAHECMKSASFCALIPAAVSIALNCHIEYPLSMTLGAAMAVWAAYGCSSIGNIRLRLPVTVLAAIIIYPLAGAHGLLFVLMAAFHERKHPAASAIVIALFCAVFAVQAHFYEMQLQEAIVYPLIYGYTFRIPLLCLAVEVAAVAAFAFAYLRYGGAVSIAFALLAAAGIVRSLYDAKEEYDLKISTLAYNGRWEEVKRLGAENPCQSQTGAYYYNLAMAREGRLPDTLLEVYQPLFYGLFLPVRMSEGYMKVLSGADALIECGDYGQAQHSAMLGMVFTPNQRSSRAVRKLAEIAVFNGDTLASRRYLGMLGKTTTHRKWASDVRSMIDGGLARPINNNIDTVYFVNDYRVSLKNVIESSASPDIAIDYLLCYDLLNKNLVNFMEDYDSFYLPRHFGLTPPRIYQEALEMMEAGPGYGISRQVRDENQMFLSGRENLFQKSYWFYFKYAQPGDES